MPKAVKTVLKVLGITAGTILAVVLLFHIAVNSALARKIVSSKVSEFVGTEVTVSRIHFSLFKAFPDLYLEVDRIAANKIVPAQASLRALASYDDKKLTVNLDSLGLDIPGAHIFVTGQAADVLGDNPAFKFKSSLAANMAPMASFLPEDVRASGKVSAKVNTAFTYKQLQDPQFKGAQIKGSLEGDSLHLSIPTSGLLSDIVSPSITFSSGEDGIAVKIGVRDFNFSQGDSLKIRVHDMSHSGLVDLITENGETLPRFSFNTTGQRVFCRFGENRIAVSHLKALLSARKRSELRKPSLRGRVANWETPDFLKEKDFRESDLKVKLDDSTKSFFRKWIPSGTLEAEKVYFATPAFPLRTRVSDIDLDFSDSKIQMNEFSVRSGSSDLRAKGTITGIRSLIYGFGVMKADLDINSSYLNTNELLAAIQAGTKNRSKKFGDEDESFVTDTLKNSSTSITKLIVVPANLDARLRLNVDSLSFRGLEASPLSAALNMRGRCLQLKDAKMHSNYGNVSLNAYYSTKTKEDISSGLDLNLSQVSAHEIISLMPIVDSILPMLKSFEGNLGCNVAVFAKLDTAMNILVPTMDGIVSLSGKNLNISDAGSLRRVTSLLFFRNKNIGHIDDMDVSAYIHDNKIEVYPFNLGVDRYKLALSGTSFMDNSFNYHISVLRSPFLIRFGINLFGDQDNWKFRLGRAKYKRNIPAYTEEIGDIRLNIRDKIIGAIDKGMRTDYQKYNESIKKAVSSAMVPDGGSTEGDAAAEARANAAILEQTIKMESENLDREINAAIEKALELDPISFN